MVCQACNAVIGPDVRFCPRCGAPAVHTPAPPQQAAPAGYVPAFTPAFVPRLRVTRNLQALGVLWCLRRVPHRRRSHWHVLPPSCCETRLWRLAIPRPHTPSAPTDLDGLSRSGDRHVDDRLGCARVPYRVQPSEPAPMGQNAGHRRRRPCAFQVPARHCTGYLHALGVGAGRVWRRIRFDHRTQPRYLISRPLSGRILGG